MARKKQSVTVSARVIRESGSRLWGLDAKERLSRQLEAAGVPWDAGDAPGADAGEFLLLLDANYLFETRTIKSLLEKPNAILCRDDQPAAAIVERRHAGAVAAWFEDRDRALPEGVGLITKRDLVAFDDRLRRAEPPLLERVDDETTPVLEATLYGNAYKGITDLVTKFAWPRPALHGVRLCANLGITPNMITVTGFLLVILATFLFWHGHYAAGLAAGWFMTYLDTVDGKLARVTVQSSPVGHLLDHVLDLFHPPLWYLYWGISLTNFKPVFGLNQDDLIWLMIGFYAVGRLAELAFHQLGSCGVFTWRPFDAWVRLVTARRNPCLIILTVSVIAGRPDLGFIGVCFWTYLSTIQLVLRLLQGLVVRLRTGPLSSWLEDEDVAERHAGAYEVFGRTRAAYRVRRG